VKRRIVLLGPPASGKGTQAQLIRDRYEIEAPSPGAILREQLEHRTPLGIEAGKFTSQGRLVPDHLIVELVRDWLSQRDGAFIFDGFPRTVGQADAFEEILAERRMPLEVVLSFEATPETIERRVARRLVCSKCETSVSIGLHVSDASSPCPRCGGKLQRRADDAPEILRERLVEYGAKTAPLAAYYRDKGLVRNVDANRPPDAVFSEIVDILEQ
jgi:adenylate kinase